MNFEFDQPSSDGYAPSSQRSGPYESSIASSASSSQVSVFSDTLSASSSIATSISDDFRFTHDDVRERDRVCAQVQLLSQAQNNPARRCEPSVLSQFLNGTGQCPTYADVTSVPPPQRQHPRRCSLSKGSRPPPLVRQRDRKINFVDNLVDSATQMVEVVWPLSVVPCQSEVGGRGVLPLRTYIEETLRRSRTSYSTLQVALYYLVLIRPHIPKTDFTMEQLVDCPADRALMCGRRMFLAALILASKYLQDRNYSAKAWSKMSGLKICEINGNERTFLSKINWKLHIAKPTFERWQEVVLRYTPQPLSPSWDIPNGISSWKRVVPLLTPDLENLPLVEGSFRPSTESLFPADLVSPTTPTPTKEVLSHFHSSSHESTPTLTTALPRFLEPKPELAPPTPGLARLGPLPTPNMTPSSVGMSTPAASAHSSRRPSMCSAMATVHKNSLNRSILDLTLPPNFDFRYPMSRRPSLMSVNSSGSSPESMISDNTLSSRSSSTSSAVPAVSATAPQRACLARQATCRSAGLLPFRPVREEAEGCVTKPIVIDDDVEMVSSPVMADFSISEKALHAPHRHSRNTCAVKAPKSQPTSAATHERSKKRGRGQGNRRSELQEEVRYLLEESLDDSMELDDEDGISPPASTVYAASLLSRRNSNVVTKEAQPPASLSRRECSRVPVLKFEGKKRTCCSARDMSISPVPLYGEV